MTLNQHPNWIAAACARSELVVWAMRDRSVLAKEIRQIGTSTVSGELQTLAADWQAGPETPAILCGAADASAVRVPAKPLDLLPEADQTASQPKTFTLPGLSQDRPVALMNGSATTIAGFISLNPDWDGVLCIVGDQTHWVQISAGEVVSFQSFLTIASFGALSQLPHLGTAAAVPGADDAVLDAVEDAMAKPERLTARIAELGADRTLADPMKRSRLLGALLGAELAAARPYWLGQNLALLSDGPFRPAYAGALDRLGAPVTHADAERMTLEGLIRGWRRLTGD